MDHVLRVRFAIRQRVRARFLPSRRLTEWWPRRWGCEGRTVEWFGIPVRRFRFETVPRLGILERIRFLQRIRVVARARYEWRPIAVGPVFVGPFLVQQIVVGPLLGGSFLWRPFVI
ncbi:MAG: hypothetical protein QNM02_12160 [Acidimicrobiia bacterium]|nr:hypothetical protein [Acidimicrobiia bacterium]